MRLVLVITLYFYGVIGKTNPIEFSTKLDFFVRRLEQINPDKIAKPLDQKRFVSALLVAKEFNECLKDKKNVSPEIAMIACKALAASQIEKLQINLSELSKAEVLQLIKDQAKKNLTETYLVLGNQVKRGQILNLCEDTGKQIGNGRVCNKEEKAKIATWSDLYTKNIKNNPVTTLDKIQREYDALVDDHFRLKTHLAKCDEVRKVLEDRVASEKNKRVKSKTVIRDIERELQSLDKEVAHYIRGRSAIELQLKYHDLAPLVVENENGVPDFSKKVDFKKSATLGMENVRNQFAEIQGLGSSANALQEKKGNKKQIYSDSIEVEDITFFLRKYPSAVGQVLAANPKLIPVICRILATGYTGAGLSDDEEGYKWGNQRIGKSALDGEFGSGVLKETINTPGDLLTIYDFVKEEQVNCSSITDFYKKKNKTAKFSTTMKKLYEFENELMGLDVFTKKVKLKGERSERIMGLNSTCDNEFFYAYKIDMFNKAIDQIRDLKTKDKDITALLNKYAKGKPGDSAEDINSRKELLDGLIGVLARIPDIRIGDDPTRAEVVQMIRLKLEKGTFDVKHFVDPKDGNCIAK